MMQVYEEMTTLPKLVAPLLDIQKDLQERLKILNLTTWIQTSFNTPVEFPKKDIMEAEIERVEMKILVQTNESLDNNTTNTI